MKGNMNRLWGVLLPALFVAACGSAADGEPAAVADIVEKDAQAANFVELFAVAIGPAVVCGCG